MNTVTFQHLSRLIKNIKEMKQVFIVLCVLLLITSISAKAQNIVYDANAEVRTVSSFNKVKISGALAVYISQGKEQAVAISSEDGKYNDKIKTEVSKGTLKIYVDGGSWNNWNWGNKEIKAYITVTEIQGLDVGGASTVKITDPIKADNMSLDISGASGIRGEINAASLSFDISGASVAEISGSTNSLYVESSGASSFRGYDLTSEKCKTHASGASGISVTVSRELEAEATGASTIGYKGDAVITSLNVSGGSSVKKKG